MSNNHWLHGELSREGLAGLSKGYSPLIELEIDEDIYRIYAPGPSDYLITRDFVESVKALGGNTIVYSSWCSASSESIIFADGSKIEILSNGAFFKKIRNQRFEK